MTVTPRGDPCNEAYPPPVLYLLCHDSACDTVENLRDFAGGEFRERVRAIAYESLWRRFRFPDGLYVFTDLDVMPPRWRKKAITLARRLRGRCRIGNDPERTLDRVDFQALLHRKGINPFRYHPRETDPAALRWPVFLRGERDHDGARSALLKDADELRAAFEAMRKPQRSVIVEFEDTASSDGWYRKYGVCRVGERIFPRHLFFSKQWMVKQNDRPIEEQLAEEDEWVASFDDHDRLRRIFDLAGIDYGRMDLTYTPDGLRVWEINTNPMIMNEATRAIESRWPHNRARAGSTAKR